MKLPSNPNTRYLLVVGIVAGIVLASAVTWTMAKSNQPGAPVASLQDSRSARADTDRTDGLAKAELSVSNLSCGGCVDNIKAGLAPLPGIGRVAVDIAGGKCDVYYDAGRLTEPKKIAAAISDAGYPAKIQRLVSAQQVTEALAKSTARSKTHIASVGQLEVPRQDFMNELSHAQTRYQSMYGANVFDDARGQQFLVKLKAQIAQRLISEHIKLQEVDRAGYSLPPGRTDEAMQAFLAERKTSLASFKSDLDKNGYAFDYFEKKFVQRVRLQSYIEDNIMTGSVDPDDRQQRYTAWLANTRSLANVVYYDQELEALSQSASGSGGCGGGGGGSCGGGSCSVKR